MPAVNSSRRVGRNSDRIFPKVPLASGRAFTEKASVTQLEETTPEAVIARIEAARSGVAHDGAIAFDGDGTLWSGDVGEDFFFAVVDRGDFRAPAVDALRRTARDAGVDDAGDGRALARALYDAYTAGAFPEERICQVITWSCAGWTRAEVDELARGVCADLAARLHPELAPIIAWARSHGVETLLVSASPREVVEAGADVVGIARDRVVAATARYGASGVMLADVVRPIPYGPGKVTGLRALLGDRPLYAAFGDNVFDVAMLNAAAVKVAVRPKARLVERAHEVPGLLRIARG